MKLQKIIKKYICENFHKIIEAGESSIGKLYFYQLKSILRCSYLEIQKEETILDGVLKWIKHDEKDRINNLNELLSIIKIPSSKSPYMIRLIDCSKESIIPKYRDIIINRCKMQEAEKELQEEKIKLQKIESSFIFFIKKSNDRFISSLMLHNDENKVVNRLRFEAVFIQTATIGKSLFILFKPYNKNELKFEKINLENERRIELTSPPLYAEEYTLQTDDSKIYLYLSSEKLNAVCNSFSPTRYLSYDVVTNQWFKMPTFKAINGRTTGYERYNSCFKGERNSLYSIGGRSTSPLYYGKIHLYAHFLDTRTNGWQCLPALLQPRELSSACAYNNELYVSGGIGEKTVEMFDKRACEWNMLNAMPCDRYKHTTATICDELCLIGGIDHHKEYKTDILRLSLSDIKTQNSNNQIWKSGNINIKKGQQIVETLFLNH